MDRRGIGAHELQAIDGERGTAVVRAVRQTSPTMADALTEFAFGQIFCKAELGRREREIATVAMLGALGGAETQLRVHLGAALRAGVDPDELIALCEHLVPYAGFPRALNTLREARAILEDLDIARPRPPRRVMLGDHETVVSDNGQGEPYVLIHALGADWRVWRDAIPGMAEQFRVLAYDLRSHGYAANAPRIHSVEQLADDLAMLFEHLGLTRAHVAGLSLGGCVAQRFALKYPERVSSLALVCTTGRAARDRYLARANAAEKDGMAAQVASSLLRWFTPELVAENGWYVRYMRERIIRAEVPNWAASWRTLAEFDALDEIAKLNVPTHVIGGELDAALPVAEFSQPIVDRIPRARLSIVPGAPHMVPLVKPHDISTLLTHI